MSSKPTTTPTLTPERQNELLSQDMFGQALRTYTQPPFTKEHIMKEYNPIQVKIIMRNLEAAGAAPYDPTAKKAEPEAQAKAEPPKKVRPEDVKPDMTILDVGLREMDFETRLAAAKGEPLTPPTPPGTPGTPTIPTPTGTPSETPNVPGTPTPPATPPKPDSNPGDDELK